METEVQVPKLEHRPTDGHKCTFGKVCIVAGSVGMSGAAALAGRAALRAGAGLVRVATARSALPVVASIEPCYTTISLAEDGAGRISGKALGTVLDAVADNDVLAFGPGAGRSSGLRSIVAALLKQKDYPLVVDGDGLNNLAGITDWPARLTAALIVTPHPGEMRRLWSGLFREELPADRIEQARTFARNTGAVVVLKGAGTVVSDRDEIYVNKTGNPGMATAGSGDVLTGVITALLGQDMRTFQAAVLGVYVHGLAGDIAASKLGQVSLTASDIIEALPEAFKQT